MERDDLPHERANEDLDMERHPALDGALEARAADASVEERTVEALRVRGLLGDRTAEAPGSRRDASGLRARARGPVWWSRGARPALAAAAGVTLFLAGLATGRLTTDGSEASEADGDRLVDSGEAASSTVETGEPLLVAWF